MTTARNHCWLLNRIILHEGDHPVFIIIYGEIVIKTASHRYQYIWCRSDHPLYFAMIFKIPPSSHFRSICFIGNQWLLCQRCTGAGALHQEDVHHKEDGPANYKLGYARNEVRLDPWQVKNNHWFMFLLSQLKSVDSNLWLLWLQFYPHKEVTALSVDNGATQESYNFVCVSAHPLCSIWVCVHYLVDLVWKGKTM